MLKARHNPFATDRIESRLKFVPEWSGLTWQGIDGQIARHRWRCAIAGGHGSGKTTLLDSLELRLREQGIDVVRLFFNDECQSEVSVICALRKSVGPGTILLCDGAEQLGLLPWLALRSIAVQAKGLIVTCHEGAKLPVAIRLAVTPELVEKLLHVVEPSINWSGNGSELILRHNGNVREIFRSCYFMTMDEKRPLSSGDLAQK